MGDRCHRLGGGRTVLSVRCEHRAAAARARGLDTLTGDTTRAFLLSDHLSPHHHVPISASGTSRYDSSSRGANRVLQPLAGGHCAGLLAFGRDAFNVHTDNNWHMAREGGRGGGRPGIFYFTQFTK